MSKTSRTVPLGPSAARKARQAEALRRNLARRKQQARDRAAQGEPGSRDTADSPAADDEG